MIFIFGNLDKKQAKKILFICLFNCLVFFSRGKNGNFCEEIFCKKIPRENFRNFFNVPPQKMQIFVDRIMDPLKSIIILEENVKKFPSMLMRIDRFIHGWKKREKIKRTNFKGKGKFPNN